MANKHEVKVGRAYEPRAGGDDAWVLADRIWPRELGEDKTDLDEWGKAAAPSTSLRKWYARDPKRLTEFARRYRAELKEPDHSEAVQHL